MIRLINQICPLKIQQQKPSSKYLVNFKKSVLSSALICKFLPRILFTHVRVIFYWIEKETNRRYKCFMNHNKKLNENKVNGAVKK